jgi:pimeloyl-ACP methyl ester carboxylesterase
MDYRGFGESDGERFTTFQERQSVIDQKWPGDVDAALAWLSAQPGVDRERIGAAGASCGVNQAVLLSRRHPEVKTLVLLSGGVTPPAREHLRKSPGMPVFGAASQGDGDAVNTMRWILGWSSNPANKFIEYKAAGHGTEMFAAQKDLEPAMLDWFDAHLKNASPHAVATTATAAQPSRLAQFWDVLAQPDGRARAQQMLEDTKRQDPKLVLFPEGELNAYGYQILQTGSPKHAVWLFQMNVDAYPNSANAYDSLSDALLAAGDRQEALRNAEKALELLDKDKTVADEFRAAIKESAEKKIRELKKS